MHNFNMKSTEMYAKFAWIKIYGGDSFVYSLTYLHKSENLTNVA